MSSPVELEHSRQSRTAPSSQSLALIALIMLLVFLTARNQFHGDSQNAQQFYPPLPPDDAPPPVKTKSTSLETAPPVETEGKPIKIAPPVETKEKMLKAAPPTNTMPPPLLTAAKWLVERLGAGVFNEVSDLKVIQQQLAREVHRHRLPFGRNPPLQSVYNKIRDNFREHRQNPSASHVERIPLLGLMCTSVDFMLQLNLMVTLDVPVDMYVMVVNGDAPLAKVFILALAQAFPGYVIAHLHDKNEGVSRGWNLFSARRLCKAYHQSRHASSQTQTLSFHRTL